MSDHPLSDEDKILFRQLMSDVKPLQTTNKVKFSSPPQPAKPRKQANSEVRTLPSVYLSDHYTEEVQASTILFYCSHSIPKKRLHELKTGQIAWQAQLDLHGLRPDSARETLIKFIEQQTALAHRCLLIVHGKGSPQGEAPVLKNLVNRWLPQFPQVLAFHSAMARDGGTGALYVLLKRFKPGKSC